MYSTSYPTPPAQHCAAVLLFEQSHETGLFEMVVACQRFRQTFPVHDDEGNAIRQRPFLVASLSVKTHSFSQQMIRARHDGNVRVGLYVRMQLDENGSPKGRFCPSVRRFGQDPARGHDPAGERLGERDCPGMCRASGIEQGKEIKGVRKDSPHRFGVPWI